MKVGVRDLVADDHHADAPRVERLLLRLADGLRHREQVTGEDGIEVDPVVDFPPGHDERVARVHRRDRQDPDALRIAPHEDAGDLAIDDLREDRRHGCRLPSRRGAHRGRDIRHEALERGDGSEVVELEHEPAGAELDVGDECIGDV